MTVYPRGRVLQRGGLATPAGEGERQPPDRLSLRTAILYIGILSLGAWVAILGLLHALG
jgi:hypothetical protein